MLDLVRLEGPRGEDGGVGVEVYINPTEVVALQPADPENPVETEIELTTGTVWTVHGHPTEIAFKLQASS